MTFTALSAIWTFLRRHWRGCLIVIGVLLAVIAAATGFKWLTRPKPIKIDEKGLQRLNSENVADAKKELRNVIEENADLVRTADERLTIAETNVIERNRLIEEKVAEASAAVEAAKRSGRDVTAAELECILKTEACVQ